MLFISGLVSSNFSYSAALPTIAEKTADFRKYEGFTDFYWDEAEGKIWLEIDQWETEFL
jgi:hypothetical protein